MSVVPVFKSRALFSTAQYLSNVLIVSDRKFAKFKVHEKSRETLFTFKLNSAELLAF